MFTDDFVIAVVHLASAFGKQTSWLVSFAGYSWDLLTFRELNFKQLNFLLYVSCLILNATIFANILKFPIFR